MGGSDYRPVSDVWDLTLDHEAYLSALWAARAEAASKEPESAPTTDTMILARSKVPFYGAYPAGFLGRARAFLCREDEMLLHVCGGQVKKYPFAGLGKNDRTVDLDEKCAPDFLMDVREIGAEIGSKFPEGILNGDPLNPPGIRDVTKVTGPPPENQLWPAVLIDRPYTVEDAKNYLDGQGPAVFPDDLNDLLRRSLGLVVPGGRVGVLDYIWPQPPKKGVRCVAAISVLIGFNNRVRLYSVYEREPVQWRKLTGARGKVEMGEDVEGEKNPEANPTEDHAAMTAAFLPAAAPATVATAPAPPPVPASKPADDF